MTHYLRRWYSVSLVVVHHVPAREYEFVIFLPGVFVHVRDRDLFQPDLARLSVCMISTYPGTPGTWYDTAVKRCGIPGMWSTLLRLKSRAGAFIL